MKGVSLKCGALFHRWSYGVPLLCYVTFLCLIWMLSLPLKSNLSTHRDVNTKTHGLEEENAFHVKIRNSNFNSDKNVEDALLNDKNEYLVNVNDHENLHKDRTQILEEVFKKYV